MCVCIYIYKNIVFREEERKCVKISKKCLGKEGKEIKLSASNVITQRQSKILSVSRLH